MVLIIYSSVPITTKRVELAQVEGWHNIQTLFSPPFPANPRGSSLERRRLFRKPMIRGNELSPQLCHWWLAFSMRMHLSFTELAEERAKYPRYFRKTFHKRFLIFSWT